MTYYVVFKGTVPAGNKKFSTYEAARQWVRKYIRKTNQRATNFFGDVCWTSNPMIGDFGYRIKKIA